MARRGWAFAFDQLSAATANGVQTVNIQDSKFASGPFALQFGNGPKDGPGGVIKWRKVQVRPL